MKKLFLAVMSLAALSSGCATVTNMVPEGSGGPGGSVIPARSSLHAPTTPRPPDSDPDKLFNWAAAQVDDTYKYADDTKEPLGALRGAAEGKAKARQAEFAESKTYRKASASRCVYSTQAFGTGENPQLAYRFTDKQKLFVRCYAQENVKSLTLAGWTPYVRLSINAGVGGGAPATLVSLPGDDLTVVDASFDLPQSYNASDDFALIDAEAGLEHITGYRWENKRSVATYERKKVAAGAFLWERKAQ